MSQRVVIGVGVGAVDEHRRADQQDRFEQSQRAQEFAQQRRGNEMGKQKAKSGVARRRADVDGARDELDDANETLAEALDYVQTAQQRERTLKDAGRAETAVDARRRAPSLTNRRGGVS
jgi:hypothetical protein